MTEFLTYLLASLAALAVAYAVGAWWETRR